MPPLLKMFSPSAPALKIVFEISIVHFKLPRYVVDATAGSSRVAADRAVSNLHPSSVVGDAAARISSRVAADSAVYDSQTPIINRDAATSTGRRVTADCAVDDCDTTGGFECPTSDTATVYRVAAELPLNVLLRTVKKKVIQDAWSRVITDNAVRDCHRTAPGNGIVRTKRYRH